MTEEEAPPEKMKELESKIKSILEEYDDYVSVIIIRHRFSGAVLMLGDMCPVCAAIDLRDMCIVQGLGHTEPEDPTPIVPEDDKVH